MPLKKPIRTLAQINIANAKANAKRAKKLAQVAKSSFVAAVSARYFRRYMQRMSTSPAKEQWALFQSMPTYDTVAACADKKRTPRRRKFEQRARAKKPRKYKAYAIGAESLGSKLPLNLNAFIGDFARSTGDTARQVWNRLEKPFKVVATDVILNKDSTNPRADIYTFLVRGDPIVLKYGQFEKIFTASRKPRKAAI